MSEETGRRSVLRWTLPIDGVLSFVLAPALIVAVPVLVWVQTPAWVIGVLVISACVVLGCCGLIMAVAMAQTLRHGDAEHPEMASFLRATAR